MRAIPLLVAAFMAAGCSLALAQAGSGGAAGASGGAAGAAAGGTGGAAAGIGTGSAGAGVSGTSQSGATSAAGADQRASRSFGRFRRNDQMRPLVLRRSDEMAPLAVPREEAPVRLRTDPYRYR